MPISFIWLPFLTMVSISPISPIVHCELGPDERLPPYVLPRTSELSKMFVTFPLTPPIPEGLPLESFVQFAPIKFPVIVTPVSSFVMLP